MMFPAPDHPTPPMVIVDGSSGERATPKAAEEAAAACAKALAPHGSPRVDLLFVFLSAHHATSSEQVSKIAIAKLNPRCIIGCTGEVVIAGSLEMEGLPGISMLACALPGVSITPFTALDLPLGLQESDPDEDDGDIQRLASAAGFGPQHRGTIIFAEPFSQNVGGTLSAMSRALTLTTPKGHDAAPIVGAMASSARRPGGNALLLNGAVYHAGLVGVSLSGPIQLRAITSPGCRAFGPALSVTGVEGPAVTELSGRPALEVIKEVIESLDPDQRRGLNRGLLLGRAIDPTKKHLGRGDYLLRQILKVDEATGAIFPADRFAVGQSVRLHMRDARTADEDLAMLLDTETIHNQPAGCLLLSCQARGTRLFTDHSHDARAVQRAFLETAGEEKAKGGSPVQLGNPVALAGMFAAGEIAPVASEVYLHSQTAVAVMFRPIDS